MSNKTDYDYMKYSQVSQIPFESPPNLENIKMNKQEVIDNLLEEYIFYIVKKAIAPAVFKESIINEIFTVTKLTPEEETKLPNLDSDEPMVIYQ